MILGRQIDTAEPLVTEFGPSRLKLLLEIQKDTDRGALIKF